MESFKERYMKNVTANVVGEVKKSSFEWYNIALLYRLKNYSETETHADIIISIKKLCRQHKELTDEIVEPINRLTGFLDTSFPDFRKVFTDLQGKTALTILAEYPTVTAILDPELDKAKIINQIKTISHKSESYAIRNMTSFIKLLETQVKFAFLTLVHLFLYKLQ